MPRSVTSEQPSSAPTVRQTPTGSSSAEDGSLPPPPGVGPSPEPAALEQTAAAPQQAVSLSFGTPQQPPLGSSTEDASLERTSPVDDGAADAAAAVRASLDGAYSHPPPMVPIAASRARSRAEWDEAGGDVETGSLPQQVAEGGDDPAPPRSQPFENTAAKMGGREQSGTILRDSPDHQKSGRLAPYNWSKVWWKNEVLWLGQLLPEFLCLMLFRTLRGIWGDTRRACSSWTALRRECRMGRKLQFFFKYYLCCAGCTIAIFIFSTDMPSVVSWNPLYVLFTVVVVLSEKVETTVQKGIFRAAGTVFGGAIGYAAMLRTQSATSPVLLVAVLCVWVFLGSWLALKTEIRYAVFLTIITTEAVILCQYQPNAPPGYHGTAKYFYARVVDIAIGLVLVMVVDLAFLPWYSSEAVLGTLGDGFLAATETLRDFHAVFFHALEHAGSGGDEKHQDEPVLRGRERTALEQRLGARLALAQTVMAREQVLWSSGYLAMPQVVPKLQECLTTVLLRMGAVEAPLQARPVISGRYTNTPFALLLQPMQPAMEAALAANIQLGEAINVLLSGDERGHCQQQLIEAGEAYSTLQGARLQLRRTYLSAMATYHDVIRSGGAPHRTPDDAVRWLSYAFATSHVLDKCMLLANIVRTDPFLRDRCTDKGRCWGPVPN